MNVVVLSGQATSGVFTTVGGPIASALAIFCPQSMTVTDVRVQFATASGGTFGLLTRPDGSGVPISVMSGFGPGVGIIAPVPSAWGRVSLVSSQADVRSFEVVPVY